MMGTTQVQEISLEIQKDPKNRSKTPRYSAIVVVNFSGKSTFESETFIL